MTNSQLLLARHLAGPTPRILLIDRCNASAGQTDSWAEALGRTADPTDRAVTLAVELRDGLIAVDADDPARQDELNALVVWLVAEEQPFVLIASGGECRHHVLIAPRDGTARRVAARCWQTTFDIRVGGQRGRFLRPVGAPPKHDAVHGPRLLGQTETDAVANLQVTSRTAHLSRPTKKPTSPSTWRRPRQRALTPATRELIRYGTGPMATPDGSCAAFRAAIACARAGYTDAAWIELATDPTNQGLAWIHSKRRIDVAGHARRLWAEATTKLARRQTAALSPAQPADTDLEESLARVAAWSHAVLRLHGRHTDAAVLAALCECARRAGDHSEFSASVSQVCEIAGEADRGSSGRSIRRLIRDGIIRVVQAYNSRSEAALAGKSSTVYALELAAVETPPMGGSALDNEAHTRTPRGAIPTGCGIYNQPTPFVSKALGGLGHAAEPVYRAILAGCRTLVTIAEGAGRVRAGASLTRGKARALLNVIDVLVEHGLVTLNARGYRPTRRKSTGAARRLGIPAQLRALHDRHRRQSIAWVNHLQVTYGAPEEPLDEDRYIRASALPPDEFVPAKERYWAPGCPLLRPKGLTVRQSLFRATRVASR